MICISTGRTYCRLRLFVKLDDEKDFGLLRKPAFPFFVINDAFDLLRFAVLESHLLEVDGAATQTIIKSKIIIHD